MTHWNERPCVRVLAFVLALLLALNTIPSGGLRTFAGDTGAESTTSATIQLMVGDTGRWANIAGSYTLRVQDGGEEWTGNIDHGTIYVEGFTNGETYDLFVNLGHAYAYDSDEDLFLTIPDPVIPVILVDGDSPITIELDTVSAIQRFGYVKAEAGEDHTPVSGATVTVNAGDYWGANQPTDANGAYTVVLPAPLITQEVSVTVQKNGYVAKTEKRIIPDNPVGEELQQAIGEIVMTPVTTTFDVGDKGCVYVNGSTTPQIEPIQSAETFSFTVASNDENYQVKEVSASSGVLSEINGTYSFAPGTEDVTISVSFIKKDQTAPKLEMTAGDDNTYFKPEVVYSNNWGTDSAEKVRFLVSDPQGKDETTEEVEFVSGTETLYYISDWINDGDYAAFSGGQAIDAAGQTYCDVPISIPQNENQQTYSFYLVDGAGNKTQVYRFTFAKDASAPLPTSAWLAATGDHRIERAYGNAFTSDADIILWAGASDVGSGIAKVELFKKGPSDSEYVPAGEFSKDPESGNYSIVVSFTEITELEIQATDNAGNKSEKKQINELGLEKNAVLITAEEETKITAIIGGETYNSEKSYYFNEKPDCSFTIEDIDIAGTLSNVTAIINNNSNQSFPYGVDSGSPGKVKIDFGETEKACFIEGKNTITIRCRNKLGLDCSWDFTFILDTVAPTVTGVIITPEQGTTFYDTPDEGPFANGPITVLVNANDGVDSSNLLITLYLNGTEYESKTYGEVFTLSPNVLVENGILLKGILLSAVATDAAGNASKNQRLMQVSFDIEAPVITVSDPMTIKANSTEPDDFADFITVGEGTEQKTWFSELIRWNVKVSDGTAGVASIEVYLNGTKLDSAMNSGAISDAAEGFDIASSAIADDCSCKLTVTATDKLGNTRTFETKIYIDMFAPVVKEFRIEAAAGTMDSNADGNYTNGPVKVYVKAEDPGIPQDTVAIDPNSLSGNQGQVPGVQPAPMPTSGLAKVVLYLNDEQSTVQFGEATTQENGYYVFTIPADVAENFYKTYTVSAKAYDASGLESAVTALTVGDNGNASLPSERIIIENKKPGAVITLSDSGKKTIDGNTWYGADTEVKIQATDAESGLSTIAVTVNGVAITADDSETPQAIGTFASKEKTSPVYVIKTANHIASDDKYTIRVTAKDVSGNTYETEATFYIDRKAPTIAGFTVTTEKATDTISSLAFGTFANGRLRVTVTVQDAVPSAGLDFVALTVNDGTPIVAKLSNGVAEFILPEEVTAEFYGAYSLKATAVDVYGHTSEVKAYEKKIEIDTVKPVVSVSAAGANAMAKDGNTWYSSDVTWTIRLTDANAGIASATVKVNGNVISTDANGKAISDMLAPTDAGSVKDVTFAVVSSQGAANADGSYTITVEATDYIGNKSEIYSGTVFVDKAAPSITSFAFLRDGETVSPLTASDSGYVYFFDKDATVVISARDAAAGYGLKTITYYMEDFNGVKTAEQTVTPDASGNVTITVKAPFRGKIYAKATDGVNNESGYAGSRGFAAESKANHDAAASVSLERNETELKQPNGLDLYSGNVDIKINIADEIAGIKTVEWSVSAPYDQAKNQTGSVTIGIDGTISADGWAITGRDGNLVTGLSRTITVTHDSNDIMVRVRMTDWAGNQTERQIVFGIDKVAPTVEYSFDNNTGDRDNPNIFNDERTLTITVTERNFVPGEFAFNIHNAYGSVPTASQWTEERDVQDPNKSTYTATVTFTYDGSYTVGLAYADRAGNRATIEAVPTFVIDQSKPLVLVTYDNKKPVQDIYFDNFRTATVTVTEKNFDVSRVTFTGNAPRTGSWTANGDEHTLIIYYDEDGDYSFGISVTDKAGNVSVPYDEENFIIDTTAPELDLSGLLAANRGEVAPVITYTDANYLPDGVSILLMRQSGEIISKPYTLEDIVEDGEVKGYRVVFKNFDPMKENDDIYTISISAVDHAGNRTKEIMRRFSVNRFGSTYIMDGAERMNRVNTNNPTDLSVLEINVDEINSADVEIFVIRNSSPKKLEQGVDYVMEEVKSEDADWKEYRYTIKNTAFMEDGEYTIRIISTDKAGNVNENDENGKNGTISFCVDRIAPNIVVVSPVDEESYKEDTHRAVIEVRDNYLLDDVKIYLNDQEISYAKNNYQYSFDIPQSDTKQTIRIVATDAAGNVSEVTVKDFLVSTNMFVRFLNTPWAAVTFIVILLGVGAGAVLLLARKRRRVS